MTPLESLHQNYVPFKDFWLVKFGYGLKCVKEQEDNCFILSSCKYVRIVTLNTAFISLNTHTLDKFRD